MSYQVLLRRAAQRQLDRIPKEDYTAVARVITALGEEPRPRGVKKLSKGGLWRVRVGPYRVVYSINDEERLLVLVRVARRAEDTYRGL